MLVQRGLEPPKGTDIIIVIEDPSYESSSSWAPRSTCIIRTLKNIVEITGLGNNGTEVKTDIRPAPRNKMPLTGISITNTESTIEASPTVKISTIQQSIELRTQAKTSKLPLTGLNTNQTESTAKSQITTRSNESIDTSIKLHVRTQASSKMPLTGVNTNTQQEESRVHITPNVKIDIIQHKKQPKKQPKSPPKKPPSKPTGSKKLNDHRRFRKPK